MTLAHVGQSATGAPSMTWVRKWYMDPQNDGTAVDIKGGGTYTDDSGITWQTSDGTVSGDANASAIDIVANTGLRITTSAAGNIFLARAIDDLIGGDFALTDRLLFVMHTASVALPENDCRHGHMFRTADDNWRHRIVNELDAGTQKTFGQRLNNGTGVDTNLRNAESVVTAIEMWGYTALFWYGDAYPTSDPLTDDLTNFRQSSFNLPPSSGSPTTPATDEWALLVRRNGSTDFTLDVLHAAIYRLEAV